MAVPWVPGAARGVVEALTGGRERKKNTPQELRAVAKIQRLGMSPKQQELNHLLACYLGTQYDARAFDWQGQKAMSAVERELIAAQPMPPPGTYDSPGADTPLSMRKPVAPTKLVGQVVDTFTNKLFSSKNRPTLKVAGDATSTEYLNALVKEGGLFASMLEARKFGGACGAVPVGFLFKRGKPKFVVFNPVWSTPVWEDESDLVLSAIDYRFMIPREVWNEEHGGYETEWLWRRTYVDGNVWAQYKLVRVADGGEPRWEEDPSTTVYHKLGFCPVVWFQNSRSSDDPYGMPDCFRAMDAVNAYDILRTGAYRTVLANTDPLWVATGEVPPERVGDRFGKILHSPEGGITPVEAGLGGAAQAQAFCEELREDVMTLTSCYIQKPTGDVQKTATEVERLHEPMALKIEELREVWGERLDELCEMVLRAVRIMAELPVNDDGSGGPMAPKLPPKVVPASGDEPEALSEYELGAGEMVQVVWPKVVESDPTTVGAMVSAAAQAKEAGLIDDDAASRYVAPSFGVEDVGGMLAKVEEKMIADRAAAAVEEQIATGAGEEEPV